MMFDPEKCPKCGKTTVVEHYATGWRCVCDCPWFGPFHFDSDEEQHKRNMSNAPCGISMTDSEEDLMLANAGMDDYATLLDREEQAGGIQV